MMSKEKIKDILVKFCNMMLEKEPETQFIKIQIGMKDKTKVKFKKFREG